MDTQRRTLLASAALAPALALIWSSPALGRSLAETREDPAAPRQEAKAPAKTPPTKRIAGKKADAAAVPGATVEVSGSKGADEVYRVEAVNSLGPLGSAKLLDIPNSISILPATLLENVQAVNVREALKYVPLAQFQEMQGSEILRPATRGMQGSNYQNTRLDGMTMFVTGPNPLESMQQIEVFSGLPASVFGPSNPAGVFNFVSKRPTSEPMQRVDLGFESANIRTAHADLSGQLGDWDKAQYRLNLLDSHGTAFAPDSELDRKLASLALDIHPSTESRFEFTFSRYDLMQKGFPGWFTYGEKTPLPSAPDPTKAGLGQPFAGIAMKNQSGSLRYLQNLGSTWVLVVGGLAQGVDRNINTPVNNLAADGSGDYTSALANGFAPHFGITSDIAYLTGTFRTGDITHDVTVGTTGCKAISKAVLNAPSAASVALGTANLDAPQVFPTPAAFPDVTDQYTSSVARQQGVNLSDTIGFTSQWAVKVALSQDWMQTQNYAKTGAGTTSYNKNGLSPMPSLIFKPAENVTYYLTYASSLQQGDLATSGSANQNEALAPYRSTQYEVGAKYNLATIDLAFAAFKLERPFAYANPATDNVFKIQGNQVNEGVEATAAGKLTESLRLLAGITLLDAKLQNTITPATNGQAFVGLPKLKSNFLFEYWVPAAPGLVGTLDWQYNARRPANDTNTTWAPSYSVFDLGARYSTRLMGKATTWRLAVDNLTDVHYWSTIGPSTITGVNTGNLTAHLGAPRTVAASMSVTF